MGNEFEELYCADLKRYGKAGPGVYIKMLLRYMRKTQTCKNRYIKMFYKIIYGWLSSKHGLEIPWRARIGKGLYLGHVYNITLNPDVIIGENCNLHKGVVIGQTNRGLKKGVPTIGNSVWIGINAAIVGGITIGDDVLIAPNSYVNCDVPSHSVVYGNPCIVVNRKNATDKYINNKS